MWPLLVYRTQKANILTKYGRFDEALAEYDLIKSSTSAGNKEELEQKIERLNALKAEWSEAHQLLHHDEAYAGEWPAFVQSRL